MGINIILVSVNIINVQPRFIKNIITSILAHGADVNSHEDRNFTALHGAANKGYVEVAKLLIKQPGNNLNAQLENQYTPVNTAIYDDKDEVAKVLINTPGVDLNLPGKENRSDISV